MLRPPHDPRDKTKRDIAAMQKRHLRAAVKACGPAAAYARWSLNDNLGLDPQRVAYTCRLDGKPGWNPSAEEAFGALLTVTIDADVQSIGGQWPRYSVGWTSICDYNPVPESTLEERRSKRKEKQQAKQLAKEKRRQRLFP